MSNDPIADYEELRDTLEKLGEQAKAIFEQLKPNGTVVAGLRELNRACIEAASEAADAERDVESRDAELATLRDAAREAADVYSDAVRELAELAHVAFPREAEAILIRLDVSLCQAYAASDELAPPSPYAVGLRLARAVNPPDPTPLLQTAMALRYAVRS
jgi:hypothetical protein